MQISRTCAPDSRISNNFVQFSSLIHLAQVSYVDLLLKSFHDASHACLHSHMALGSLHYPTDQHRSPPFPAIPSPVPAPVHERQKLKSLKLRVSHQSLHFLCRVPARNCIIQESLHDGRFIVKVRSISIYHNNAGSSYQMPPRLQEEAIFGQAFGRIEESIRKTRGSPGRRSA